MRNCMLSYAIKVLGSIFRGFGERCECLTNFLQNDGR